MVETIRLGRTEANVSRISLGTWSHGGPSTAAGRSVGWSGYARDEALQSLICAADSGINHWDTADVYGEGRSECLLGEALRQVKRDDIFLASKVGYNPGSYGRPYHPDWIVHQLDTSLRQLNTDRLDLYYFHHCDFGPDDAYLDDAIDVMHRVREAGKIRFIGLSDWKMSAVMRVIDRVGPDVVQVYRNLLDDDYESSGLKGWVKTHDVGVAFFSPLRHGLLLGKYDRPTTFPEGDFRSNDAAFQDADLLRALRANRDALAQRFGKLGQEAVLHGVLGPLTEDAQGACVLLGQRNPKQVEAAARVGAAMSAEDAAWVRGLFEPLRG